jgi:hypothetical protein
MNKQIELIHQTNTWMHFIGGYYKSEDKFVHEARKFGITRRSPAQVVRGMEFGDRLVFLRYASGNAYAFAEGQITGVTFEGSLAKEVGQKLIDTGKAEYHSADGGGMLIARECGSYIITGTYSTTASLKDVMDIAQEIHAEKCKAEGKDEPLFVMVNARLTQSYENPVYLSPSPKFTRGFIRASDEAFYVAPSDHSPERNVVAIDGYAKKERKPKKRGQPLLLET